MQLLSLECSDLRATAVLSDADGRLLASGDGPLLLPSDPTSSIHAALVPLMERMDAPATAVVALPQAYRGSVAEVLRPLHDRCPNVWRCSPMEAIAAGALKGEPGVVVHCGLRASAIRVDGGGRVLTAGQADTPLGDEGSALWMAVQVVRVTLQGLEGRTPRNPRLEKSLSSYFGTESVPELIEALEQGVLRPTELAGFVSVVLQLATYPDPDPACRVLTLQACRHLVELVRYAIEHTGSGDDAVKGSWSGPALEGPLLELFQQSAAANIPEVTWQPASFGAARGGLLLARACSLLAPAPRPLEPVGADVWRQLFAAAPEWG